MVFFLFPLVCDIAHLYGHYVSTPVEVLYHLDLSKVSGLKLSSLLRCRIGARNEICLENLGPEAGQLVAVVYLDDVELLQDAAVQSQLVGLEARKYLASKIDTHDVIQLTLSLQISLIALEIVLDFMDISCALKKSVHRFLACLNVLDSRLASLDLFLDGQHVSLSRLDLVERSSEGSEIVDLSFEPMVEVGEWVSEVGDRVR